MQPKVSMVVPCYNKVKWIGNMLDSVIAQKWDNIELILVNDGSTDGTREVIDEYAPKIKGRGYELVTIDQENRGLPGAVKSGLMRITGDFVCMPDCDDELDPEYVSAMAGWLWEHDDDDWVVCDIDKYSWDHSSWDHSLVVGKNGRSCETYPYKVLESYILERVDRAAWPMMIRVSYLSECRVLESFYEEPRVSQEPQMYIPLALGGARPVHIRRTLYKYFVREGAMVRSLNKYEDGLNFALKFDALAKKVLASGKKISEYDKAVLGIGFIINKTVFTRAYPEYNDAEAAVELADTFNVSGLNPGKAISSEMAAKMGFSALAGYITNMLIGFVPEKKERKEGGRIIAYAAFGEASLNIKAMLLSSDIKPDVYWDRNAYPGDSIGGIPVVRPDFESLCSDNTVLVLLKSSDIVKAVLRQLEPTSADVWHYSDVQDYLMRYHLEA